ncbi:hypothetical protein [Flavobacterium hibernum]|uniref:Uncharacterized protein n=1 Tax=Flavobacterium hibernum TaxID=37752 RepID=A0A0D0F566_9FLAO|nr:hypothetical protein [Flavobacterium hibernum]KIO54816.1 hypothetical protein IW18_00030 [Flavobacterium hibernum]OXA84826.1 hypothetical protein B0A73_18345 [Flavobacterium hibernum]STO10217.1 Uncharacterised protein [Flavobacterium hibernum]
MKKPLTIVLIIYSFIIQAQQQLDKNVVNTIIGEVDKRDSNCLTEIERAKNDFKSKETYYYIEPEGYLNMNTYRSHSFLQELLQKRRIDFSHSQELELSSFWNESNDQRYQLKTNCYCKASNELLNRKYGINFIEKTEKMADSLYVISRLNEVFNYPDDVDDYYIIYPKAKDFLNQKIEIQKDFFTKFKFPNTFIHSPNKDNFLIKTDFVIQRNSKISCLNIEVEFKNPQNQKFKDDIILQIKKFIENANWKAAMSSGVAVDCRFKMIFTN